MSLKDLNLKGLYDSDRDNLLNDFYIPVLSESISYKRIAGYFSSNALAIAAKGIKKFVDNGGKIQLIANVILSEKDQEAIKGAIKEKEAKMIKEIETMDDALKKGHLKLLAWMIKKDKLEIKIAVVQKGIEHKKKGILEDSEGNAISFSGSDNETVKGWLENDEEFHVFCSWIEGDKKRHLEADIESFNKLWDDEANKVRVYPVSEAFREGFVKTAPKDDDEFKILSKVITEELLRLNEESRKLFSKKEDISLYYFQKKAVNEWIKKNKSGYFEMATGTGKTFTAIYGLKKILKDNPKLGVIISVPTNPLIVQWKKELIKQGFEDSQICCCSSDYSGWKKTFRRYTLLETEQNLIFIFTYQSLCSNGIQSIIDNTSRDYVIVCDEMHHAGAPKFSKCLNPKIKYRLGLSATPIRARDIEGNQILIEYFNKSPLLVFDIGRALKEVNPRTGKTYLCPYNYYFETVELSDNEHEEYRKLSRLIAMQKSKEESDDKFQPDKKRALLISCASEKISILDTIIKNIIKEKKQKRMLFYCQSFKSKDIGEKQIDSVKRILDKNHFNHLEFTSKFDDMEFRTSILNALKSDTVDAVVSIKCLDEGIDIPEVRTAVILASSSNSAEFIQRRGRILRNSPGKTHAEIYDFLVGPQENIDLKQSDVSLIKREFKRAIEYAKHSLNYKEMENKIYKWINIYGLSKEDMND
tara:strand:+ start:4613 stop:6709 length:2097 start_codon:yes stop_codon:yes gene_type:complete